MPNDSSKSYLKDEALFAYQVKIIRRLADQGPWRYDRPPKPTIFWQADRMLCACSSMRTRRFLSRAGHEGGLAAAAGRSRRRSREIDDYRARYYKHHTGHDWYDARNYDLSLNSGVLGFDGTVEEIIKYMEVREQFQK